MVAKFAKDTDGQLDRVHPGGLEFGNQSDARSDSTHYDASVPFKVKVLLISVGIHMGGGAWEGHWAGHGGGE